MAVTLAAEETYGSVKKIKWTWTSDTAGAAAGATSTVAFNGALERLVTVPHATAAPSANYDVAVKDADGVDVLIGGGANRSATGTEQVLASSLGVVANDPLYLDITNAGNTKQGTVYLYLR
jgi:hypothetical protein